MINNFPKVTQLVSSKVKIQSQVCKLPNFILYYLMIKIVVSYVAALVKPLFFVFGGLY